MSADAALLERARDLLPRLVELRRALHRRPELSYQERETQRAMRSRLTDAGWLAQDVAGTGLLAAPVPPGAAPMAAPGTALGGGPTPLAGAPAPTPPSGPTVALRAELDALPIEERNDVPYRSEVPGVMHACGHDAHMAMVFGAGLLLQEFAGPALPRVRLLFQPAEEVPPGGARRVLEEGALRHAGVGAIFGLHVDPRYPAGQLLLRRGALMAASDRFRLVVVGRGGHGGYPHLAIDPIVIAAQIVLALQTLVSRRLEPTEPGVITVGRIEGGAADNVIPERVTLTGTLRSHSESVRAELPAWIEKMAAGIAAASDARVEFEYLPGHPGLANDPAMIDFVRDALAPVLGAERLVELPKPIMGAEDFAHYLKEIPGAFLRLGVRNEALDCVHPIHSPRFNLDESALAVGAAALAGTALAWLEAHR